MSATLTTGCQPHLSPTLLLMKHCMARNLMFHTSGYLEVLLMFTSRRTRDMGLVPTWRRPFSLGILLNTRDGNSIIQLPRRSFCQTELTLMKGFVLELTFIIPIKSHPSLFLPPLPPLLKDLLIFICQMYLIRWEKCHIRWEMLSHLSHLNINSHLFLINLIYLHLHHLILLLIHNLLLLSFKENQQGSELILLTGNKTGSRQITGHFLKDSEKRQINTQILLILMMILLMTLIQSLKSLSTL